MKKMIFVVLAVMFMASPMANAQDVKVDKMPTFQNGGLQDFAIWAMSNVKYPEEAVKQNISGRVLVEFVIGTDGSVSSVKTLKSPSDILSTEAERVIKSSPKWEAGEHEGKKVNVRFVIPIVFATEAQSNAK